MSECVVRMEMPSECEYCPMCRFYRENGRVWCNAANRILKQVWDHPDWTYLDVTKPDWCPIICQLPEGHGRLVDADAVYKRANGKYGDSEILAIAMGFYGAPIIVPADTAERNET